MKYAFYEKLFSYGTLQYDYIQTKIFDRVLTGKIDRLVGFALSTIEIHENGYKKQYPIAFFTGNTNDFILGTVYEISKEELKKADEYETSAYKKKKCVLESGVKSWVYVAFDRKMKI